MLVRTAFNTSSSVIPMQETKQEFADVRDSVPVSALKNAFPVFDVHLLPSCLVLKPLTGAQKTVGEALTSLMYAA